MLTEATASTATPALATPALKRRITSLAFQEWFRGSKVVDARGAPPPAYHASPTTAPSQPKSYGTAGEHSYFYFAVSKARVRNFAREVGGGRRFICQFYFALKKVKCKDATINTLRRRDHKLRTTLQGIPDYVTFLSTLIYRLIFSPKHGLRCFP